jgi:hypothetical protein
MGEGPISVIGILAVYMIVAGKAETSVPGLWIIGVMIVIQLLGYFAIYLITPYDLVWHVNTSAARLYSHIFPLALLWLFNWTAFPQKNKMEITA